MEKVGRENKIGKHYGSDNSTYVDGEQLVAEWFDLHDLELFQQNNVAVPTNAFKAWQCSISKLQQASSISDEEGLREIHIL